MDTRTSPSMLLHRPHQRATGFPPPTHGRHAASSYFSHPPSASYHPYGYSNHCVPLNPSHVQQQQDYTQGSPDAKSTPPQDSLVSDSPADAMRATGCTCKKSRCLKLYCQCFGSSTTCGNKCRCQSCHNSIQCAKDIKAAKKAILDRNPNAFNSSFHGDVSIALVDNGTTTQTASWYSLHTTHNSQPIKKTLPIPQRVNKRGCKCRRSFCLKKYCECFHNQVQCGLRCRCLNCKNHSQQTARLKETPVVPAVYTKETAASEAAMPQDVEMSTPKQLSEQSESEDRMTMIAAVAMTELIGKAPRWVSVDTSKGVAANTKRKSNTKSKVKQTQYRSVVLSGWPGIKRMKSRNLSAGCVITPQSRQHTMNHAVGRDSSRYPQLQKSASPPPYHLQPQKLFPTYEDVVKSSGLPKALSFRKICSRCGRARGEHSELGFGNKCVFNDCGKCHAGIQMHKQYGCPMGILCCLSVKEGATPGQAFKYERKIRDLAARAKLLKSLNHNKRDAN